MTAMARNIVVICFSAFVLNTAILAHADAGYLVDNKQKIKEYIASDTLHKYEDESGDSIVVLSFQNNGWRHIALLIQDEDNKWRYFSVNGDVIWNESYGAVGLPKDDLGEHSFISPYDFLECEYNSSGSYLNKKINTYGYDLAYIIPSSPGQDIEMIDSFKSSSKQRYDLITNNCATAVNNAIGKAFKMRISSWWPDSSYDEIKKRIKGKEVKK